MIRNADQTSDVESSSEVIIIQNWVEELKRLVP